MTWASFKYIKLLLHREAGTRDRYLIALRTTADYYGWPEQFPEWTPETTLGPDGRRWCKDPGRRGRLECEAGMRLRVCRSPSTGGHPAGMTNAFKVSNNCRLVDIAEVAHFTQGDWHWLTSPNGERISRDRWEEIFQVGNSQQRRGLVSS